MPRSRDPNLLTGYLCRFCGERITWGTILRLLRIDPDTPGYMLNESYCHTDCLERQLRAEAPLGKSCPTAPDSCLNLGDERVARA